MRIVANLLCEMDWARAAAAERGVRLPDPRPRLVSATSALGALVAAVSEPGDSLWTPVPVDPSRLLGLPQVALESGPLTDVGPKGPFLAWGVTDQVARTAPPSCAIRAAAVPEDWVAALRWVRPPTAATHRRVCDRRRQLDVATRIGAALPGATVVADVADVEAAARLAAAVLGTSPAETRWVVKAPWSSAGRDRLRGRGPTLATDALPRLERLLAAHGELLFEPWLDRIADFGAVALVAGGTVRIVGFHRQETAGGGALRGIRPLGGAEPAPLGLTDSELGSVHDAVHGVGLWLLSEGYEGPFGLDVWRYRDATGEERLHATGEINARLTFGAVARRLAERAGWDPRGGAPAPALRIGSGVDLRLEADAATPLLLPSPDEDLAVWLA